MAKMHRILIVDDEEGLSNMLKSHLEKKGWVIELAKDGEEGLQKARAIKPNLILLDIMMPKMNGYQVCNQLKSDQEYKDIPILMATARDKKEEIAEGLLVGADDYLPKPYDLKILVNMIKQLLKGK